MLLYVTGYSACRIFEESIRIDSSAHVPGLRLNMYIAVAGTLAGAAWLITSLCIRCALAPSCLLKRKINGHRTVGNRRRTTSRRTCPFSVGLPDDLRLSWAYARSLKKMILRYLRELRFW